MLRKPIVRNLNLYYVCCYMFIYICTVLFVSIIEVLHVNFVSEYSREATILQRVFQEGYCLRGSVKN